MSTYHYAVFSPVSAVQAQNSGTVTIDYIIPSPKDSTQVAGELSFGNLSQSGTLAMEVYTGMTSSVANATQWVQLLTQSLTASSTVGLALTSLSNPPILPYLRTKISAKAGGAPASVFENIVAKLAMS